MLVFSLTSQFAHDARSQKPKVHSTCSPSGDVILLNGCFVVQLDLSLCGRRYCKVLVLLVQVLIRRIRTLSRAYCVICTMYAAACSIRVVVSAALLFVTTVGLFHPCWERLSVVLSWSGSLSFSRLAGLMVGAGVFGYFMAFGVLAGHQRFCWGLC